MSDAENAEPGAEGGCGPEMPQPTAEHNALLEKVGRWNVHCTYFMDPSQPPMENEAVETIEACGAFWTISNFEASWLGMPFNGRCTNGYNPMTGKYVATWIDSMMPHMFVMEGGYDADNKILSMTCEGPHMATGQNTTYRSTQEGLPDGKHRFEMFVTNPDGSESKMMSYVYSRAD